MSKTLLLMRHAKSSWKDKSLKDELRPLKNRGELAAAAMGVILKENELVPQLILSSPAVRARRTADIVAKKCGYKHNIQDVPAFYMAEPPVFFETLKTLDDKLERVLVVAHNPGLEALLQHLDGHVDALPTGALAYLNLDIHHWSELDPSTNADLIGFWDPESDHAKEIEDEMAKDKKDKKDKDHKKEKDGKKDKKSKK